MKGSISFEKHRQAWAVWWYVAAKRRSVPLRYYYGVKLYNRELAEKLLALVQGTQEKAKRGECVFRIENFQRGASVDVVELFESWLETKRKLKPSGLNSYKSNFRAWIKPFFSSRQIALHEITLDVLNQLKRTVEDAGKKPKTVMNAIGTMSSFLNYAWRNGNIAAVPPFPLRSEYGLGEEDILTIPRKVQFEIINLMPDIHKPVFYWLVLHPGRRPGEAMAIHKEDYNQFKNSFIIRRGISGKKLVRYPKNSKCHEAACHESFAPFLDSLMESDSPYLFVNPGARNPGQRYNDDALNRIWRNACAKYGVKIPLYNGTKHSTLDYYYNDLGVALTDLMDLTGHKRLECIQRYARMKVHRQKSLLGLEKDAAHLKLIHGGKKDDDSTTALAVDRERRNSKN